MELTCRCGETLNVDGVPAGATIQCPACATLHAPPPAAERHWEAEARVRAMAVFCGIGAAIWMGCGAWLLNFFVKLQELPDVLGHFFGALLLLILLRCAIGVALQAVLAFGLWRFCGWARTTAMITMGYIMLEAAGMVLSSLPRMHWGPVLFGGGYLAGSIFCMRALFSREGRELFTPAYRREALRDPAEVGDVMRCRLLQGGLPLHAMTFLLCATGMMAPDLPEPPPPPAEMHFEMPEMERR